MYLSESVAFKGQQSHRCFPREGVRRPCVPLTECPRYMDAWLCNQTEHVSRLESQWLQAVPEDSKGFDKHRSSIPGMQIAPEDVRLAEREREYRAPAEPDKFAQQLARAKDEPRETRTSIQCGKEHPLLFCSPDVSVMVSALCKVLTSWFSL